MTGQVITGWFIVTQICLWAAWDCYAAYRWGSDATESRIIADVAYQYPIVPLAVGVLMGHFFTQMGRNE